MALKVSRKHYHKGKLCSKKSWTYFLVLSGYLAEYTQNLIYGPNIPDSYVILFFISSGFIFTTTDIHNWVLFPLWLSLFVLSETISNCPLLFLSSIWDTFWPVGFHLLVSYLFAFSYCSWVSPGKNTGVGCHLLLQWTTFCQNSSVWPIHLEWPCMAWLSFIELHKHLQQGCDPWKEPFNEFW